MRVSAMQRAPWHAPAIFQPLTKRTGLATYGTLVRKLLPRPLNLKRVNVFTLNYDTLVEQAADGDTPSSCPPENP